MLLNSQSCGECQLGASAREGYTEGSRSRNPGSANSVTSIGPPGTLCFVTQYTSLKCKIFKEDIKQHKTLGIEDERRNGGSQDVMNSIALIGC